MMHAEVAIIQTEVTADVVDQTMVVEQFLEQEWRNSRPQVMCPQLQKFPLLVEQYFERQMLFVKPQVLIKNQNRQRHQKLQINNLSFMKKTFLTLSCILLLSACGVKDTTPNTDAPQNATGGYNDVGGVGTTPSGVTESAR